MNINQRRIAGAREINKHKEDKIIGIQRITPTQLIDPYSQQQIAVHTEIKRPAKQILNVPIIEFSSKVISKFILPEDGNGQKQDLLLSDQFKNSNEASNIFQNNIHHQQPSQLAKPGPSLQRLIKRRTALRNHQLKLQARKNLIWKLHNLYARIKIQNLRGKAPFGSFDNFIARMTDNLEEFKKYAPMICESPTQENQQKLFIDKKYQQLDDEIPNQFTDPAGYQRYVKSLFDLEKKPPTHQLQMVPYLRKIQKKINLKLAANAKEEMRYIDYSKPLKIIKRVQYFLPFGFMPRLGVYEGRNPLHLLPLEVKFELLHPIKKQKINKLPNISDIEQQSETQNTQQGWLEEMFQKFKAIDENELLFDQKEYQEQVNQEQITSLQEIMQLGNKCVCKKCHLFVSIHCLENPHWWFETFGCAFTGLINEYFDINQGPFFNQNRKQIKPFELKAHQAQLESNVTSLQQQLLEQINEINEARYQILLESQSQNEYSIKKQQLYKKKHSLIQKFLASIFDQEAPRNLHQYLALYKLQIKVGNLTVRYIPKCPEKYQAINPVTKIPVLEEETGLIQYVQKIKHKKKEFPKCIFNIQRKMQLVKKKFEKQSAPIPEDFEQDHRVAENMSQQPFDQLFD